MIYSPSFDPEFAFSQVDLKSTPICGGMWRSKGRGEGGLESEGYGRSLKSSRLFSEERSDVGEENVMEKKESEGLGEGQTEVRMRTGRDRRGQRDGKRQKNLLPSHS